MRRDETRRLPWIPLLCGLLMALVKPLAAAPAATAAHPHPAMGPHGGTLIELGREDYHAELVHDEGTGAVTIYILDASATRLVAISARRLTLNMRVAGKPRQFFLAAVPQPGDAARACSTFSATDAQLGDALHARAASGRLNVEIEGKVYVGAVGGHAHPHPH